MTFFYHDNQENLARYIEMDKKKAFSVNGQSNTLLRSHILIKPNLQLPDTYQPVDASIQKILFKTLYNNFTNKAPPHWQLKCKFHLLNILLETYKHLIDGPSDLTNNNQLVAHIDEYIEDHISSSITIGSLADIFHYHRDTLGRIYKRQTGMTIKDSIKKSPHHQAKTYAR